MAFRKIAVFRPHLKVLNIEIFKSARIVRLAKNFSIEYNRELRNVKLMLTMGNHSLLIVLLKLKLTLKK